MPSLSSIPRELWTTAPPLHRNLHGSSPNFFEGAASRARGDRVHYNTQNRVENTNDGSGELINNLLEDDDVTSTASTSTDDNNVKESTSHSNTKSSIKADSSSCESENKLSINTSNGDCSYDNIEDIQNIENRTGNNFNKGAKSNGHEAANEG